MWNQTPLLQDRASRLPDRSGDGLLSAIRDVVGSDPVHVHVLPTRRGVAGGVVLARGADPGVAGPPGPRAGREGRVPRRRDRARRQECCALRKRAGVPGSPRTSITPIDVAYPVLWRNLTASSAAFSKRSGRTRGWRRAPVLERQADQRSDEWVDRYRAEARGGYRPERRVPPTSATTNIRRNGKIVVPSGRGG